MALRSGAPATPPVAHQVRAWLVPAVLATAAVLAVAVMVSISPADAGLIVLLGAVGAGLAALGLGVPMVAVILLLVSLFFRLPLSGILPTDPFLPAFAGVLAAAALAFARRSVPAPRWGGVELAMALYLLWNIGSSIATHRYPATVPVTGEDFTVWRFILTGTAIPFALYIVGRFVLAHESAVRWLLWMILAIATYSAAVSYLQLNGPTALVWPRYIVASPDWDNRAVGIFNQPVVNGLVLIIGFVVALLVASRTGSRLGRVVAGGIAVASAYGVFLTHTRAVWLAFALVLVLGAVFATGFRTGFVLTFATACLAVATNWSTFVSSDRAEGGVGSAGEVEDRLNTIATSAWAIEQKPLAGWGIGRFIAVNTYHHGQWSADTPWIRGFGISSHFNELGIGAELGICGLVLWLVVLAAVARRLYRAFRLLDGPGISRRGITFLAGSSFAVLCITGLTVDLRFFDFTNALVMTIIGTAVGLADRATAGRPDAHAPPLPAEVNR